MRPSGLLLLLALPLLLLGAGCANDAVTRPPVPGRFYFPTGLDHVAGSTADGILLVASSNFDRRYDFGSLTAVDLSTLGLPAFGSPPPVAALEVPDLQVSADNEVFIANFAGELATFRLPDGTERVFVPTRGE